MKKIMLIVTCLSVISMIFLPIAAFSETENEVEKVSIQLQWKHQFEFAGFYAAKEKGYYSEAGLDVDIRDV